MASAPARRANGATSTRPARASVDGATGRAGRASERGAARVQPAVAELAARPDVAFVVLLLASQPATLSFGRGEPPSSAHELILL